MGKIAAAMIISAIAGSLGLSAQAENHIQESKGANPFPNPPVYLEMDDDVRAEIGKQVRISTEEAKKRALAVQQGTIREIELESERGALFYSIEIRTLATNVDVYVDARTGETWRKNDPKRMAERVKISLEDAKKIAVGKVKGTVVKAKLDEDDGQYLYEVEIRTAQREEVEMEISATTGAILDVDWDD